ncbi:unnamed protein product [Medioppia subpectinata]|uniref:TIR domain-containing protein n=1 Tax=Medioppia subpectinata TaxID=1979941 RepID=A0A7R9PYT3_9ACAR|nr:unnamed protein product [Medioppia subpectinata]CAG2105730.1 unnamed protein product [Medioppia subpectinata]
MPDVPSSRYGEPVYSSQTTDNTSTPEDRHNSRFNFQHNFPINEILANVSEEQLEEITHTFHVNMVSESYDNHDMSSRSSSDGTVNTINNHDNTANHKNTIVCGVVVVDERVSFANSQRNLQLEPISKNSIILGAVVLNRNNYSCEEIRRCLQTQLSSIWDSQQKFSFLTKEGQLRDEIDNQFKEIGLKNKKTEYIFIERNGWPVATNQEPILSVWDIIVNQNICIQSGSIKLSNIMSNGETNRGLEEMPQLLALNGIKSQVTEELSYNNTYKTLDMTQTDSIMQPEKGSKSSGKSIRKSNFSVRQTQTIKKSKLVRIKSSGKGGKVVMLSYCRQEASQHALDLKDHLLELGFSVYLDVHEIQTGTDWADSLNDAVRGCEVFVPLITPMYGRTQWTNREIKLADILSKFIIPINFLDTWPPDCLAIQFATTQYIPSRPLDGGNETNRGLEEMPQLLALNGIKSQVTEELSYNNTYKTLDMTQTDSIMQPEKGSKSSGKSIRKSNFSVRQTQTIKKSKLVRIKSSGKGGKVVMLSYCRQEASQHALDLKDHLLELGFSVYLDVHEIQTGTDWADSLNDAVRGCEVFVPLITPMYGRTQWTNRNRMCMRFKRIKLADILSKFIIPINFLDTWPPDCLAIQFATTQYIPSRPLDGGNDSTTEKSIDIKIWHEKHLKKVSELISDQIKKKKILPNFEQNKALPAPPETDGPKDSDTDKPLIVIVAHPQQKATVSQIRSLFCDEFNIWCSIDLPEGSATDEDLANNSPPFTPNHLATIDEASETQVFSDDYKDIARNIIIGMKQNSKPRPKSLPSNADFTIEPKRPLSRVTSTTSETSHLSSLTPEKVDRIQVIKEQINSAGVVIIVCSESYYKSRTSKQLVFYCEQRKKIILVRCDVNSTSVPQWFSNLLKENRTLHINNPRFDELLKSRVKRTLDPLTKAPEDDFEQKIQYLVGFMKKNLPVLETCVYVVGSIKLQNPRSEEICQALGVELAKVKNVNVVTSGFYGAGDIVAKSFYESRQTVCTIQSNCKSNENTPNSFESSVVHIVPECDSEDFSSKCRQNCDGTFESVPYGKTMFLGQSVKERESCVARLLDTCILIEGGPGAAHEAEEFIWNDHFVIPIISSGGAAGGQYNVPTKIFDCPNGVAEQDWALLSSPDATPIDVAKAVVRIVVGLKETIVSIALSKHTVILKAKNKFTRTRSGKKKLADRRKMNISAINASNSVIPAAVDNDPNSPEKVLPVINTIMNENESMNTSKPSKWQIGKRMQNLMTFSRKKC